MQFEEREIRFLRQEFATQRLRPIRDLRELGCPARIFERVLEDRARKLGPEFAKFRAEDSLTTTAPLQADLAARVESAKLF